MVNKFLKFTFKLDFLKSAPRHPWFCWPCWIIHKPKFVLYYFGVFKKSFYGKKNENKYTNVNMYDVKSLGVRCM